MISSSTEGPRRLMIVRPTMGQGGADRVTLTLLQHLERSLFSPSLVLMRPEGELLNEVPDDIPILSLDASRLWNAWLPLKRLFEANQPEIVFSTCSGANIPVTIAHLLSPGSRRLVLSERNVLFHGGVGPKRLTLNLLKALLYRGADEITVVSDGVKKDLMTKLRIPVDRISVVHNPIDIEEIREKATLPIPHPWFREDVPIILGVGRLVHEKDFRTLIDAFQQVRVSHPSRLVILGEGPLRRNLEKQIRELLLQDHVLLPGYDPNPFPYMARATVFVLSSRDEGLPNVLLQSMACETPVIATRCHSGPEEIITNGSDGLLVPVGDSAAMAGAIVSVLESPELQRQLVAKARESMRRFSAEVVLERYTEAAWPYVSPRNNHLHSESQWRAQNKNSR